MIRKKHTSIETQSYNTIAPNKHYTIRTPRQRSMKLEKHCPSKHDARRTHGQKNMMVEKYTAKKHDARNAQHQKIMHLEALLLCNFDTSLLRDLPTLTRGYATT